MSELPVSLPLPSDSQGKGKIFLCIHCDISVNGKQCRGKDLDSDFLEE
jgi:hypothetical protein